jgi:hypothetical protein
MLDAPLSGTFGWRHASTGKATVTSAQNIHSRCLSSSAMPSSWTFYRYSVPASRRGNAAS